MFTLILVGLIAPTQLYWNGLKSYATHGVSNGHRYAVTIRQANFDPHDRKLVWVVVETARQPNGESRIHELRSRKDWDGEYSSIHAGFREGTKLYRFYRNDGREYREVVGKKPLDAVKKSTEITLVEVKLDGKVFQLPLHLYCDLLNPNLGSEYVHVDYSKKDNTLRIGMMGSDGAGGYAFRWIVDRKGNASRQYVPLD